MAARRGLDPGSSEHRSAELIAWTFGDRHMVPTTLGHEELGEPAR
ncbi:hypothetical protein [Streptomyces sp. SPB074]|nr:hypothetical protein [Streptomyces sp. SPB074]